MDADDAAEGDDGKKAEDEPGDGAAIDVAALAERVYRLMCRELRLERARGASLFGNRRY
jgi:hypothetical protein